MSRSLRLLDNESGIVEVTSRTLQGRYLLRPSEVVNDLILGILGYAQALFGVELYAFVFMSNHFHLLMRALAAREMSLFIGFVKTNIAKEIGRVHDWKGTFWGPRYHSSPLSDSEPESQVDRLRYILLNGCKENLVASPGQWPGVNSAQALCGGEMSMLGTWYDRTAEHFQRRPGGANLFPVKQKVRLSPLPYLDGLTAVEQQQFVNDMIREIEQETRARHLRAGTQPLGVEAILGQNPHGAPESFESSPAKWFHCITRKEYRALCEARALTVAAYREAAERLRNGDKDVEFPEGTFPPPAPFVGTRDPPEDA